MSWQWLIENMPGIAIGLGWALTERRERIRTQERYLNLSERSTHLIAAHTLDVSERERRFSRERVELVKQHSDTLNRNMLQLDSTQRTALAHFESLFDKLSKAYPDVRFEKPKVPPPPAPISRQIHHPKSDPPDDCA